jgi:hypothetical protein
VSHDEVTGGASDVDPMIRVGRVAENPLVLFVESVHQAPREGDRVAQRRCLRRRVDVLPGAPFGDLALAAGDGEPFRPAEVLVRALAVAVPQHTGGDVADREVGNRIAGRLEQEHRVVASGDDVAAELDAHPPAERLEVEHPFGHRRGGEKRSDGIPAQRPLLP